jgi:NAD(P)-dependent dehydrogenase (short-subunit alcohol dehydrogenase family)
MAQPWTPADIPDLTGRVFVVTGATSGLGLANAAQLARHGGSVVVTGRNPERLQNAWEEVTAASNGPEPDQVLLDLADLSSVQTAAAQITELHDTVHVLINNAGIMAPPLSRTVDDFESQIGTNHLGHFALTGLLLPALPTEDETADARVVTVSSGAHRMGKIDLDDLNYRDRRYEAWQAYGQTKLANLLFTRELSRRAQSAGLRLKALAAHPGWSATNLQYAGPAMAQNIVGRTITRTVNAVVGQSAEVGSWPQVRAATDPAAETGEYYGPDGFMEMRGKPVLVEPNRAAQDDETAAGLWDLSEELTGVHFLDQ